MNNLKRILSVVSVSLLLSCTWVNAKPNQFEADAEMLCSLYDPARWKDLQEGATGYEIYLNILAGIEQKIISEEVKQITTGYKGADINSYYDHVFAEMHKLLNKPWKCEHFDNFYRPKVEVVAVQIDSVAKEFIDPYAEENIIISISNDGYIFINNAQLKNTSPQLLKKAILSVSKGKDLQQQRVFLDPEEQSPNSLLVEVIKSLKEMGIGKMGIVGEK